MSILLILTLVFAVVLLALIAFNVPVSQKVINIFVLVLIILLVVDRWGPHFNL